MRGSFAVLGLVGLAACAETRPEDALDAYRRALQKGDADQIWALSDASFRAAYSKDDLERELKADPARRQVLIDRLAPARESTSTSAVIALENGERVTMVLEDGRHWKIASGGVELARFDSPEHALASFFRAVEAGRLDVVRVAIPRRHAESLATDDAIRAHIQSIQPRIERARAAIGALAPGRAVIQGARAELPYAAGKRVVFEQEEGSWKIVDLE